ncbi:hypothetical protein HFM82_14585 [Lactobacillus plantarum]|uniref:hypothetical protein n=1 Tax=Lactiplantibacillus plantarum TaxID=1590 RepID=UPI00143DC9DC|nr:hypothetical protein [Lactiplantibacillus plantarum]MBE1727417.1 hypothetical protein [Lactiplantibacillus plantarum]NKI39434.1 hypothetical protein [Lactiplantibacillus plantarum]
MDLSTETLNHIEQKALAAADKTVIIGPNGETFLVGENVQEWHQHWQAKEPITTSTLSSIVEYLQSGTDLKTGSRGKTIIHIISPTKVQLLGELDPYGNREELMVASPVVDRMEFGRFIDRERMNIMLQAMFVPNDDRAAVLTFIGNLTQDNNVNVSDDGVTQSATVKTGVASQGVAKVPNPVNLMPYRTFGEVAQPASDFIFRVNKDTDAALFEADGGAWRQEAINNIKAYLADQLNLDSTDNSNITVLG